MSNFKTSQRELDDHVPVYHKGEADDHIEAARKFKKKGNKEAVAAHIEAAQRHNTAHKSAKEFDKNPSHSGNKFYMADAAAAKKASERANKHKLNEEKIMGNSQEIIDHLYTGNLDKMREAFQEAMKPEIANILATKRLEVGIELLGDKNVNEEVLSELSKKTLGSYVNKASDERHNLGFAKADVKTQKARNTLHDKDEKRKNGISKAVKRLTKEEIDLQELSKKTLGSYINKAVADKETISNLQARNSPGSRKTLNRISTNRRNGIEDAVKKIIK